MGEHRQNLDLPHAKNTLHSIFPVVPRDQLSMLLVLPGDLVWETSERSFQVASKHSFRRVAFILSPFQA